jgi:hypothetical protein
MGGRTDRPDTSLRVIETVRCLGCGAVYSRRRERSTSIANPGCPECTYVGWEPARSLEPLKAAAASPRFRSVAGRLQRP